MALRQFLFYLILYSNVVIKGQSSLFPSPVPVARLSLNVLAGHSANYSETRMVQTSGEPNVRIQNSDFTHFAWVVGLQYNWPRGFFAGLAFKSIELGCQNSVTGWRDSSGTQFGLFYGSAGKRFSIFNFNLGYRLAFGRLDFSPRAGLDYIPFVKVDGVTEKNLDGVQLWINTYGRKNQAALFNLGTSIGYSFTFRRNSFVRIAYDVQMGMGNSDLFVVQMQFRQQNQRHLLESRNKGDYLIHAVSLAFPLVKPSGATEPLKPTLAD